MTWSDGPAGAQPFAAVTAPAPVSLAATIGVSTILYAPISAGATLASAPSVTCSMVARTLMSPVLRGRPVRIA